MSLQTWVHIETFSLGVFAIVYVMYRGAWHYWQLPFPFCKAIAKGEVCQSLLMLITLLFGLLALAGWLPATPEIAQAFLRNVIFLAPVYTTWVQRKTTDQFTDKATKAVRLIKDEEDG